MLFNELELNIVKSKHHAIRLHVRSENVLDQCLNVTITCKYFHIGQN